MLHGIKGLKEVDPAKADLSSFKSQVADCVILTQDGKILMQQRPSNWVGAEDRLTTFGGHLEANETPLQGLIRELKEELGAQVNPKDVMTLGALSEDEYGHDTLVHVYFWRDTQGTITGCYEAQPRHYDKIDDALAHPKIPEYAQWALLEAKNRGLLETRSPNMSRSPSPKKI